MTVNCLVDRMYCCTDLVNMIFVEINSWFSGSTPTIDFMGKTLKMDAEGFFLCIIQSFFFYFLYRRAKPEFWGLRSSFFLMSLIIHTPRSYYIPRILSDTFDLLVHPNGNEVFVIKSTSDVYNIIDFNLFGNLWLAVIIDTQTMSFSPIDIELIRHGDRIIFILFHITQSPNCIIPERR